MASIELWGAQYCSACDKAKAQIVASDPAGHGVEYRYVDVTGQSVSVPKIHLGNEVIEGYDQAVLAAGLQKLYAVTAHPAHPVDSGDYSDNWWCSDPEYGPGWPGCGPEKLPKPAPLPVISKPKSSSGVLSPESGPAPVGPWPVAVIFAVVGFVVGSVVQKR